MKIYTRTGDSGKTGLLSGERVWKDDPRLQAIGSVDELNAWLGWIIVKVPWQDLREQLGTVQEDLHLLAADLACGDENEGRVCQKLSEEATARLESWIDELDKSLEPLRFFIRLGGHEVAAMLHIARTVCRRAEREIMPLQRRTHVRQAVARYLNRLSDYLFTAARVANARSGLGDRPLNNSR